MRIRLFNPIAAPLFHGDAPESFLEFHVYHFHPTKGCRACRLLPQPCRPAGLPHPLHSPIPSSLCPEQDGGKGKEGEERPAAFKSFQRQVCCLNLQTLIPKPSTLEQEVSCRLHVVPDILWLMIWSSMVRTTLLWIVDCGLWIADCGFRTVDCGLRIVDCGLEVNRFRNKCDTKPQNLNPSFTSGSGST